MNVEPTPPLHARAAVVAWIVALAICILAVGVSQASDPDPAAEQSRDGVAPVTLIGADGGR